MLNLGTVKPGSTVRIPFSTFDKDDGSAITMTNFAAADILVYKDGSTTERASTAGFTATTDFDSKTGKHVAILDLADNTTANFWGAGSEYLVAIDAVTVDAVTTGGWIARFVIGYPDANLDTTIATLASQTSFTLTTGPAEDDALNGHWAIIHDLASAVQRATVRVLDYTGSTKTVTLAAGATFTAAAGDNFSLMDLAPLQPATTGRTLVVDSNGLADANTVKLGPTGSGTAQTARDIGTSVLLSSGTGTGQVTLTSGRVNADLTHIAASSVSTSTAQLGVNVVNFGGSAGTFASGRPEVNTSHAAGTAWNSGAIGASTLASDTITDAKVASDVTIASVTGAVGSVTGAVGSVTGAVGSVTGNVGGNVTGSVGSIASGGISEASFATTAGSFTPLGIVDQGTAQSATGTTLVLRSAAAFANDELLGAQILITGGSTGVGQTRTITDYVSSTDTATVDTWTTTPSGTITYKIFASSPALASFEAAIADAVWDEAISGHAVSGSTGEALSAAGAAGDPWITALPGSYSAGQAGYIVGTNLNATVSSRASQTSVDTIDDFLDAEVAAILADTNELQTDWANGGRLDLILDARASQTSVDDLPTNAELATSQAAADDATLAAIAALTIPSAATIADAVWDEALSGHAVSGSTGEALGAAGGAGDPWITSLPGAYSSGQAGYILGTNLNATVSSRASQTSLDTVDDFLDTEIAAIKAKTDNLPSDPADASDIASSFTTVNTKLDTIDDFLDTEVAAIKTKTDYLPSATAGAAGGLFIAGTNAATTITTALTTTFTGNLTGSVGSVTGAVGSVTGAVGSVTGNVGGNVTGSVGSVATGGIVEASFATTAGSFAPLGIVDQGTAQSATGTTLVLRSAAAFADDELIGNILVITGGSAGVGQARAITDYVGSTDTATVDTWATTPTGTITYKIIADKTAASGSGLDAAGVRAAIGMASANLDTQLDALPTAAENTTAVWAAGTRSLTVLDEDSTTLDLDATIRAAVGMSSANLDTQLTAIDDFLDTEVAAIKAKTDSLTFTVAGVVDANTTQWKGSTAPAMTGDAFARLGAPAGASVSADVAAVKAQTAAIETDTAEIGAAGAGLTVLATAASLATVDDFLDTEIAAIKAKTDSLTFTVSGQVDANIQYVNDTSVGGDGSPGTEWGP